MTIQKTILSSINAINVVGIVNNILEDYLPSKAPFHSLTDEEVKDIYEALTGTLEEELAQLADSVDDAFAGTLWAPKATTMRIERAIDPFESVEVYEGDLSAAREMGVCANASGTPTSPRRFPDGELNPIYK
jgi:hypothetical protein